MNAQTEAVELREASFGFGELRVLDSIDLTVRQGEVIALVGPSGCGKSTLLELLAGLREPTGGRVEVEGMAATDARRAVLMPQRDSLLPWLQAIDNAALPLRVAGEGRSDARRESESLLAHFGLAEFAHASPAELSGGMRQRVAFARTLLARKPVLALDEPFASLDAITRADMQEWLAGALAEEERTVVLVSHDVEEALYLADRVAVLSARPARIVATVLSPRPRALPRAEAVTASGFVAARERAMEALTSAAAAAHRERAVAG